MDDGSMKVGLAGYAMGFNCLIGHLHAKGVIDKEEFADLLDAASENFEERICAEMRVLALIVRDRPQPQLSIIAGDKDGGDDAA